MMTPNAHALAILRRLSRSIQSRALLFSGASPARLADAPADRRPPMEPLEPRLLFSGSPADLDLDFDVDDADYALFFAAFSGPEVVSNNPAADLDNDGDVDDADFALAFADFTGPAVPTELTSGMTETGTISRAREVDLYTIDAQAGDDLLFTLAETDSGSNTFDVALYGPDGALVSEVLSDDFLRLDRLNVSQSGTYTFVVCDSNNGSGTYSLTATVLDTTVDVDNVALNSGQPFAGTIALGDIDTFTIEAQAGDDLLFTLAETDSGSNTFDVALYGPDGALVSEVLNDDFLRLDRLNASKSGTYTFVVRDSGNGSGGYSLTATVMDTTVDAGNVVLNSGQSFAETILLGDIDTYTIDAQAGDDLLFTLAETSSGSNTFDVALYGPDGQLVSEVLNDDFLRLDTVNATQSGTYTFVVRDSGNGSGTYSLTATVLDTTVDVDNVALNSGQSFSETILLGDIDTYTIEAQAGDDLLFTLAETSSGSNTFDVALYGPDGQLIDRVVNDDFLRLDAVNTIQSGTYTFVVRDSGDGSGGYSLTATVMDTTVDADNVALNSGQSFSESIALGDIDTYSIDAQAGDDLLFTLAETSSGSNTFDVALYGPDGQLVDRVVNDDFLRLDTVNATQSGTYTFVVRDSGNGSGGYSLTATVLDTTVDVDNVALNSGQSFSETILLGDIDTYTIEAQAGDDLLFTLAETSSGSNTFDVALYGPDGTLVNEVLNDDFLRLDTVNVSQSGTYTFVVRDSGNGSGGYSLTATVLDTTVDADNTVLSSGVLVAAGIDLGDIDTFTIDVQAGDNLLFTLNETSSGSEFLDVSLYGPDGLLLSKELEQGQITIDLAGLTQPGSYTFVVRDSNDESNSYQLTATLS